MVNGSLNLFSSIAIPAYRVVLHNLHDMLHGVIFLIRFLSKQK